MADIAQRDFTKNLFALLKETFEGPGGSTYLDKGAGLFQTLDALTAQGASHVPYVGAQTICGPLRALGVLRAREPRRHDGAGTTPRLAGDGGRSRSEIGTGRSSKVVFDANMMR
jgi:hypothetical protein